MMKEEYSQEVILTDLNMDTITNVKYIRDFVKNEYHVYYSEDGVEHHLITPISCSEDFFPRPTNKDEQIIREDVSINNDNA